MPHKSFSAVRRKAQDVRPFRRAPQGAKNIKTEKEAQSFSFFTSKSSERLRFEQSEKRFTEKSW